MPNWTDEQKSAINAYGSPVIVSAAAGSGKTAVLVERTIRLLCDESLNIPANALLAVTFTNDAASQMRQKLSAALENAALDSPDSTWIQRQQSLLRLADICTINSFCFDMVKNNLSKTEFQSGVRIMEEKESQMVASLALNAVMENAYIQRPDKTERLISLFCCEDDAPLREMVTDLYKFLRSLPFGRLWADKTLSSLEDGSMLKRVTDDFMNDAQKEADALKLICDRLKSITDSLANRAAASQRLYKNCEYAADLVRTVREGDWDRCREALSCLSWVSMTGANQTKLEKQSSTHEDALMYENAKRCLDSLKGKASDLAGMFPCSLSQAKDECKIVIDCFSALLELAYELEGEVMRRKIEKNAVDFADTELITVRLLADCHSDGSLTRTQLAEEIYRSGRYKLILIDEFQDVNNLQEVIFKAISDTTDMKSIGKNVFVVGDVKQAIYRFRQANPKIFMDTRKMAQNHESGVTEMLLTKNFRSRKSVLDFANYIFSSLMTEQLGEVDYTEQEELVNGAEFEGSDIPCGIITVNSDDCASGDGAAAEFSAVAKKIRRMIDTGVTVRDENGVRPCRAGDFCVLTRNNITDDSLSESFKAQGLKIMSESVSGYLESREISLMLNLLRITVSPMRDIPLASVMLSPLMGFTDDEIALVKLHNKKNRLYKNILELSKSADEGELCGKCRDAVGLVKRLRVYSASMPLTSLIKKIYDVTDIFSMAAAYEDGNQKRANLYLLLEYAGDYERSSNEGVAGFLQYIGYILKTGGDFARALTVTETEDAVNVKTMHKSKGLEYPFVFLCRLTKKFNFTDVYDKLQLNADCGVGVSFYDYSTLSRRRTVFADYIRKKNTEELLSEELRLMYVALTRAKEGVFIVLDINKKTLNAAQSYCYELSSHVVPKSLSGRAKCMQDWLVMALMKHPEFSCVRDFMPGEPFTDAGAALPEILIENSALCDSESAISLSDKDKSLPECDASLADRIFKSFEYKNDKRLCENEAKISVSELVKDDALSFFPRVPDLGDAVKELTAAQKGTVMHKFMQLADYAAAAKNLESEISRMNLSGVLSQKEADSIDRKSLSAFFESDIYRRMSASKNVLREKSFIVRFTDISAGEELASIYAGTDGMLQGIADCIFEEDDGYVIVDYKTDRVKSLEELKDRYSMQLMLYKAAFDIILDKPVKSCCIYSYKLAQGIEVKLNNLYE